VSFKDKVNGNEEIDGRLHVNITSNNLSGPRLDKLPSLSGNASIDAMIYIAVSQRGIDSGGKYQAYTGMYGNWCTSFVSWAGNQAGLSIPNTASAYNLKKHYEDNASFYLKKDYIPKAGDVFFYGNNPINGKFDGTGHTGIVIAYDVKNGWLYTAEGNSIGDKVNIIKRTETNIYGYGSNGGTELGIIPKKIDHTR